MASLKSKRPTKKHDEFTLVEDDAIISGARTCSGQNKWSLVKLKFPVELANRNRTQIRCRWNVLQSRQADQAIATASASTTGFTLTPSRVTPLQAAVQVRQAPFPTSSPTATAQTLTTSQYLQMMTTLPNHITNPNSNVIEVLTHLLDDNDSPNHYTSVFGQYIATCRAKNFILYTTSTVRDIKAKRPCLQLQRLMSLFEELDGSMSAINGMLCGKLRSCVLNFEVNDNDHEEGGGSGWSSTFRVRKSYKEHSLAFGRLLVYLDHFKCEILLKYKIQVSGDGYSQEKYVQQGLIAKLLFELTMETVPDGDTLPFICGFALFDCFHIQHGNLKLKALNCMSKIFSSILYLMREGVVACASMMVNNNKAELAVSMIKSSKDQASTNRISPWIRITKELQRRIPKYSETMIDSDSNISYLGLHITHDKYSRLIPSMLQKFKSIFSVLFDGDDWRAFFDPSYKIHIDKNWYRNCNISVTKLLAVDPTATIIHLHSLELATTVRDEIEMPVQELVSEIELATYACGGGAERASTVKEMTVNQVMLHGPHLYFDLVHDKQASVMTRKVSPNRKQMPPSLVNCFFLFRRICLALNLDGDGRVIPTIPNRQETMILALCRHLDLDPHDVGLPELRQFFAAISNMAYSNNNKVVADLAGAKSNNHTHAVHVKNYSSFATGLEYTRFKQFHLLLGEAPYSAPSKQSHRHPINESDVYEALRFLLSDNEAEFHGNAQLSMVLQCCPTQQHHEFFILPCGHGKTMSIMIPLALEKMHHLFCGCRIIIVPYGFLMCSLLESMIATLKKLEVTIESCHGSQINKFRIPYVTQDDLPDILILTVNAASNLIRYHKDKLLLWGGNNYLRGIWIDEVQTIFDELGYRTEEYNMLRRLAIFNIPVKLLSGSLIPTMMSMVMKYYNLQNSTEDSASLDLTDTEHPQPQNLLGPDISLFIETVQDSIQGTIDLIQRYKQEFDDKSVHVICASKDAGIKIYDKLKHDKTAAIVTGETLSTDRQQVATQWYIGKVTTLITTTCGLVGNESKNLGAVFVVGPIYNLSNLVQAIGRLRPKYRGIHSQVFQIITKRDKQYRPSNANTVFLLNSELLLPDYKDDYNRVLGYDGYEAFLNSNECLVSFLRKQFGELTTIPCGRCSYCCKTSAALVNCYNTNTNPITASACANVNKNAMISTTTIGKTSTAPVNCYNNNSINASAFVNEKSSAAIAPTTNKRIHDMHNSNNSMMRSTKRANVAVSQDSETSRKSFSVIGMLKTNCLSCKSSSCTGDCVFKKLKLCYSCGGSHFNNQCPLRIGQRLRTMFEKKMKETRICMSCYGKMDGEDHGWKYSPHRILSCKMKERLKCMILIDYQQLLKRGVDHSLETYMCVNIHGSKETYDKYLASKYHV